jgi:tetratricopeptide (TPR) repeat protein
MYLAGKDDDKAQKEFEAAVRTEGREAIPYLELGKISERRKDLRAALRHYMKAGEVALPHDSTPFILRARVHRELEEKPAAVGAMMEGLLRLHKPGESDGKLADGTTYEQLFEEAFALCMDAQQFDSAVKVAMQALEHNPDNTTAQTWLHEASVASRQVAPNKRRTTTNFEATDASMVDPDTNLKKAEELLFRKPPSINECLTLIEPVIRAKPNDQKALICKAIALAVKGDKAAALPFAQRAAVGENKFVIAEANALIKALTGKK